MGCPTVGAGSGSGLYRRLLILVRAQPPIRGVRRWVDMAQEHGDGRLVLCWPPKLMKGMAPSIDATKFIHIIFP